MKLNENKKVKIVTGIKEVLELEAAQSFLKTIEGKEDAKVIFATGSSPVGFYKNLIKAHHDGKSFKKLTSFNLDEYLDVENFPEDGFKKFMKDNLFDAIDIDQEKTHFPQSPESYDKLLDEVDKFDVTILGVGTNGHIAFNEPGTSINSRTHEVELTPSTIASNFKGRTTYPTTAITMGLKDIYEKSNKIILFAWGAGKKEALKMLLKGEKNEQWPITLFLDHNDITIYTDLKMEEII